MFTEAWIWHSVYDAAWEPVSHMTVTGFKSLLSVRPLLTCTIRGRRWWLTPRIPVTHMNYLDGIPDSSPQLDPVLVAGIWGTNQWKISFCLCKMWKEIDILINYFRNLLFLYVWLKRGREEEKRNRARERKRNTNYVQRYYCKFGLKRNRKSY